MRALSLFAFMVAALAGRALALTLVIGGSIGNLSATEIFQITDPSTIPCQPQCSLANSTITSCADDNCICNPSTVTSVVACEQCMFDQIIATNDPKPHPLAGSTSVLLAYASACNITLPNTDVQLTLPPNWNGPESLELNLPATIVAVGIGVFLGGSAILLLSNM